MKNWVGMGWIRTGWILLGGACVATAASGAEPSLDAAPSVEIKPAPVPVGRAGQAFVATTTMQAPVSKICALLQDYRSYPRFMPNTEQVQIGASSPDFTVLDMTLKLPLGKIKKYRLRMEPKVSAQSCQLSWTMLPWEGLPAEQTIADTRGSWQLSAVPGHAQATWVKYTVYTDPGPVPLGLGWIVDSLSKNSIPQTLEAVRQRASR